MEPHFFFFAMAGCLTMLRRAGIATKHAALIHHQSLSISTKPGAVQTALNVQLICWTTSEQDPCNSCCATLFQTNACCHIQVWVPWNLISFFCNGRVFDHVEKSRHCHTHAALIHHQSLSISTKPGAVQTPLNVLLFALNSCEPQLCNCCSVSFSTTALTCFIVMLLLECHGTSLCCFEIESAWPCREKQTKSQT